MVDNIKVFTHSSIRVQSGDKAIYADPFEMKQAPHDADIILVTHDHHDHFSPNDIAKIAKPGTVLVVPEKMAKKAEDARQYVAIPTHYGSIVGSPDDGKKFAELVDDSIKVEIKIGND